MNFSFPIVGARFRPPAQGLLACLPYGFPLVLSREPTNAHDGNAVRVLITDVRALSALEEHLVDENLVGFGSTHADVLALARKGPIQLGYIPRENAIQFAPLLDKHDGQCAAALGFSASGLMRVVGVLSEI
jgi:HIRAN domain